MSRARARRVIVTADDFGWTDGQNLGVERAHVDGVLTHASLMANGGAFDDAVALARRLPALRVGLHLTFNEGRPLSPADKLGALVRADGSFHEGAGALLRLWQRGRFPRAAAREEWDAQIRRAQAAGIRPSHLDSHKHVHLLPPLLDVIIELARAHGIPYVRLPLEAPSLAVVRRAHFWLPLTALALRARPRLRAAGLDFASRFIGFGTSGHMTPERLARALAAPGDSLEVMVHPAVRTPAMAELGKRYRWAETWDFEGEVAALRSSQARQAVVAASSRAA